MWTVIYIAKNMQDAAKIRELLEKEGIIVMLKPISKASGGNCEVLVTESEVEAAQNLIIEEIFN